MKENMKLQVVFIAHRLSIDALVLYLAGGVVFLLAETVLPGIFSQRVNFFWFLSGFFMCIGAVAFLGAWAHRLIGKSVEKGRMSRAGSFSFLFFVGIFFVFILVYLPVFRNASLETFLPLLFFAAAASVTVLYVLLKDFFSFRSLG